MEQSFIQNYDIEIDAMAETITLRIAEKPYIVFRPTRQARIGIDGVSHYLGTFPTEELARAAYLAAKEAHCG